MLTPRQGFPALLTLCLTLCAALLAPTTALAAPPRTAVRNPVVFVHGYNADPGVWGSLREDLRADGYADAQLFSWGYDTHRR
ncbi:esterase/lipase family protein [Streptomyces cirratus]